MSLNFSMGPKKDLDTSNRSVSVQGDANEPIVAGNHNTVSTYHTTQNGQVNINAQQVNVHNEIHEAAAETNYLKSDELCQNRQVLAKYLERTLKTLRQHGCFEFRQDIEQGSYRFNHVARIEDFELLSWPVLMRGEAFFVFSEFNFMHMKPLRRFSRQAVQWTNTQVRAGSVGRAIYNFRIPNHICFAIALVDDLDEGTKEAIHTNNPCDHALDLMWYEVPVVYELNQSKLHFYDQPSGFLENFKVEMAWKSLREVARELLAGGGL